MLLKFLLAVLQYNASPVSVEIHKSIYISVTDVEETRVMKLLLLLLPGYEFNMLQIKRLRPKNLSLWLAASYFSVSQQMES